MTTLHLCSNPECGAEKDEDHLYAPLATPEDYEAEGDNQENPDTRTTDNN